MKVKALAGIGLLALLASCSSASPIRSSSIPDLVKPVEYRGITIRVPSSFHVVAFHTCSFPTGKWVQVGAPVTSPPCLQVAPLSGTAVTMTDAHYIEAQGRLSDTSRINGVLVEYRRYPDDHIVSAGKALTISELQAIVPGADVGFSFMASGSLRLAQAMLDTTTARSSA
jgi:hypothetical protein